MKNQKSKIKQTEIGMIPEDWEIKPLEQIANFTRGFSYNGTEKNSTDGEYVFITLNSVKEGGGFKKEYSYITSKRIKDKNFVNSGDIIIANTEQTKTGTLLGYPALVEFPPNYWNDKGVFSHHITKIKTKLGIVKNYLYYYLIFNQKNAVSYNTGSVIWALDIANWSNHVKVSLPPCEEQSAIAKILSDLDSKIELNQRMNKNLEAIGQAIFKHWFIDFEFPNEEGNSYKSSSGEMVYNDELGKEIPKGWKVDKLSNLLKSIESGKRPKGGIDPTLKDGVPSIGAENINGLGYYDYSSTKYIPQEYFEQMKQGIVQDEDVLLYKDGAKLGRKTMFGKGFPFNICCVNEHVFILRVNEKLNQFFLYFWFDQHEVTENIKNLNANSAQPGINKESVRTLKILVPETYIINKFKSSIKPIIEKIFLNCLESANLSQIRDSLLPKLMSGKIRVPIEAR
ncbi:restriction endonuclease subunit S [Candidatus Latescibacterota bacterium]